MTTDEMKEALVGIERGKRAAGVSEAATSTRGRYITVTLRVSRDSDVARLARCIASELQSGWEVVTEKNMVLVARRGS